MGMGMEIQMLEKSLANRINGKNYLKFRKVRQLWAAASDIYSATAATHSSHYSVRYHFGSVLHMYEGAIQSSLMERFSEEIKKMIPEESDQNKPLNSLVINYILNYIDHEWVGSDYDQERKRDMLMTASYICVTYGYSLRGYEVLWVYLQRLMDGIHLGEHDRREPHVFVAVLVRFKVEDGYIIHLLPLVNVTSSGIRIRMWLERLVALLK